MKTDHLINIINLLNVPKIGPQKVLSIISKFDELINWFELSEKQLCSIDGIDQKSAKSILSYNDFDYGKRIVDKTLSLDIGITYFKDKQYPSLLKKIYDPPVILFSKGNLLEEKEDSIAIVGTRSATEYGKKVTQMFASELSVNNITIISGLARGIDTIAHSSTVKNKGRTIAVLGNGLDTVYPSENRKLADSIIEKGALISEFPIGTKPEAVNFPRRNRIISGLSHGIIVVEAGDRSGAILTALNAIDQNREVFAVPGRIYDKNSLGCIRLIRNGAIPIKYSKDVLSYIENRLYSPIKPRQNELQLELTNEEQEIYKVLTDEPMHIDLINEITGKGITSLLNILLSLELKCAILQVGGKLFVRA